MTSSLSINQRLDALFVELRHHHGANASTFVADGLICESDQAWFNAPVRILFLLKEAHDRNNVLDACGFDLRTLYRHPDRFHQHRKTVERRLAAWATEIRDLIRHPVASEQEAFLACGVMNLKKQAGGKSTHHGSLNEHSQQDAHFIERQLSIMSPELVICGGTLKHARQLSFLSGIELIPGYRFSYRDSRAKWIDHRHPAARADRFFKEVRERAFGLNHPGISTQ